MTSLRSPKPLLKYPYIPKVHMLLFSHWKLPSFSNLSKRHLSFWLLYIVGKIKQKQSTATNAGWPEGNYSFSVMPRYTVLRTTRISGKKPLYPWGIASKYLRAAHRWKVAQLEVKGRLQNYRWQALSITQVKALSKMPTENPTWFYTR